MRSYESSSDIEAPPETIWRVMTDARGLSTWDSGVLSVDGRIAAGERIKIVSEADPKRTFRLTVTGFDPPTSMEWTGGMPLGLFRGVRRYELTPSSGGITHFSMREEYSGPMLNMIWKSMPDLQPSFDRFAQGLKDQAESAQRGE